MTDRKFITGDFKQLRAAYDLQDHHLFAIWTLLNYHYNGDLSEGAIDDAYHQTYALLVEGESGDGCLDGFFHDEDKNELYLYQVKWPDKSTKKSGKTDARQIVTALQLLLADSEQDVALTEAREKAVTSLKAVLELEGEIILRVVSGGGWAKDIKKEILALLPANIEKDRIKLELISLVELQQLIDSRDVDLSGQKARLNFYTGTNDPILEIPEMSVPGMGHGYVVLASGLSLAEIGIKYGDRLYAKNVRLYLGKGKVNKGMQNTLSDPNELPSFWYGHNGITIICDEVKLDSKGAPSKVVLTNPQIVNGCQTVTTLRDVFKEPKTRSESPDFPVMARIIRLIGTAGNRQEAAELIAFRTNSQSAVNDADLCANDPQQKAFQKSLRNYRNQWFYERKRGEWKAFRDKGRYKSQQEEPRVISKDIYQQAWRAYSGAPSEAITKKGAVWDRGHGGGKDLYDEVFDRDRRACDIALVATLFDWFLRVYTVDKSGNSLCTDIFPGLRQHTDKLPTAKTLIAAHSVALFGVLVSEAYGSVEKYPEEYATKIVEIFDRGGWVKRRWTKDGVGEWGILGEALKAIMQAWATYFVIKSSLDESIYICLKSAQEKAFIELKDNMLSLLPKNPIELVKPD